MTKPAIDPTRLDLAAEFRARPFGRHSPELQALLDVMHRAENCQNLDRKSTRLNSSHH